ncbi:MAG: DUF2851 family protein, partial [Christiangramia sp.]|nr:DUF2851 family protein [Christiangramia sp.]
FKMVQKLSGKQFSLEALFLGLAGIIKETDNYALELKKEYEYLKHKYSITEKSLLKPQFFRLRPDNFPSIRLGQLAAVYAKRKHLFQDLMQVQETKEIHKIFDIEISEYWKSHYNFGKSHPKRNKRLSRSFIELLIINCIIPLKHCYQQHLGKESEKSIHSLLKDLKPERNTEIAVFFELRPDLPNTAMNSQALLQLRTQYCNSNKCLQCELGASLLRKSPKYV